MSKNRAKYILSKYQLLLMLLPSLIFLFIFCYLPMYGVIIAFKDYNSVLGILGSPWVGLKHFNIFFSSPMFITTLKNTLLLSVESLIFGFPIPIIFALLLNQIRFKKFKRFVQTISYAPYFISTVVLVSMLNLFLAPRTGFVNNMLSIIGVEPINFMIRSEWFRPVYIISGIWQTMGWSAIIYLAALSGVSPELYEAGTIDGASRLQRILYIDIPSIMPTIIIMLILSVGGLMSVGYEKTYLMQQGMNLKTSEIISTYVYKVGLMDAQFSYSTAIGLFNSIINFILIVSVNSITKKLNSTSLW
ncbi:MAG: ABC transporter permease [Lachnospirales bacterium]